MDAGVIRRREIQHSYWSMVSSSNGHASSLYRKVLSGTSCFITRPSVSFKRATAHSFGPRDLAHLAAHRAASAASSKASHRADVADRDIPFNTSAHIQRSSIYCRTTSPLKSRQRMGDGCRQQSAGRRDAACSLGWRIGVWIPESGKLTVDAHTAEKRHITLPSAICVAPHRVRIGRKQDKEDQKEEKQVAAGSSSGSVEREGHGAVRESGEGAGHVVAYVWIGGKSRTCWAGGLLFGRAGKLKWRVVPGGRRWE